MGILCFGQKETGAKRVAMATALRVSFCFFCDTHDAKFKNTALRTFAPKNFPPTDFFKTLTDGRK